MSASWPVGSMAIQYTNTLPDSGQFFTLYETTGWNEERQRDKDLLYQGLEKSWFTVCAYEGERLVGFGRVLSDGVLHAFIVEMIVLPEYQGQGIGRQVLERLVARCLESGIDDIQLFCARDKAGFYEVNGFVRRPEEAPGMQYELD